VNSEACLKIFGGFCILDIFLSNKNVHFAKSESTFVLCFLQEFLNFFYNNQHKSKPLMVSAGKKRNNEEKDERLKCRNIFWGVLDIFSGIAL
jgi:hypothetical protein